MGGDRTYKLAVIGGSNGSLLVIQQILRALPATFSMPLVIVTHQLRNSRSRLQQVIQSKTSLELCIPLDKQPVEDNYVYLAAANYHLMLEGDHTFSYSYSEPVNYSRPSIDVLFETAAEAYGTALAAVLLTGANGDGTMGLLKVKQYGGLTIVQDPATAESAYMPEEAIRAGAADKILTIPEIIDTFIILNNERSKS